MIKKELKSNNFTADFIYYDRNKMWKSENVSFLLNNVFFEIEIYVDNFQDGVIDWYYVEGFLQFLITNENKIREGINDCQAILSFFIRKTWKRAFSDDDFNNFVFEAYSIELNGNKLDVWDGSYSYQILFGLFDKRDIHSDLGVINWYASLQNYKVLSIGQQL